MIDFHPPAVFVFRSASLLRFGPNVMVFSSLSEQTSRQSQLSLSRSDSELLQAFPLIVPHLLFPHLPHLLHRGLCTSRSPRTRTLHPATFGDRGFLPSAELPLDLEPSPEDLREELSPLRLSASPRRYGDEVDEPAAERRAERFVLRHQRPAVQRQRRARPAAQLELRAQRRVAVAAEGERDRAQRAAQLAVLRVPPAAVVLAQRGLHARLDGTRRQLLVEIGGRGGGGGGKGGLGVRVGDAHTDGTLRVMRFHGFHFSLLRVRPTLHTHCTLRVTSFPGFSSFSSFHFSLLRVNPSIQSHIPLRIPSFPGFPGFHHSRLDRSGGQRPGLGSAAGLERRHRGSERRGAARGGRRDTCWRRRGAPRWGAPAGRRPRRPCCA